MTVCTDEEIVSASIYNPIKWLCDGKWGVLFKQYPEFNRRCWPWPGVALVDHEVLCICANVTAWEVGRKAVGLRTRAYFLEEEEKLNVTFAVLLLPGTFCGLQ